MVRLFCPDGGFPVSAVGICGRDPRWVEGEEDFPAWVTVQPPGNLTFGDGDPRAALPGTAVATATDDDFEGSQTGKEGLGCLPEKLRRSASRCCQRLVHRGVRARVGLSGILPACHQGQDGRGRLAELESGRCLPLLGNHSISGRGSVCT